MIDGPFGLAIKSLISKQATFLDFYETLLQKLHFQRVYGPAGFHQSKEDKAELWRMLSTDV
jgi:hypothetical protein